jgi:anhydro-N-acetylmuramic acid kinase
MVYRAIGVMSGSSLDGLDIVYAELEEKSGSWSYAIRHAACMAYSPEWKARLALATSLTALDYLTLDQEYGHFIGQQINQFIDTYRLHYQVQLIASHGHTSFHLPVKKLTHQLGDGSAIAAVTGINVICDLRKMDVALGGQGAPIVPIGEKLLLSGYDLFLNLGGIANLSAHIPSRPEGKAPQADFIAFDICPANRVLNMLAAQSGLDYDANGAIASSGQINRDLLDELNGLAYYQQPFPKSLGNEFGIQVVYPLVCRAEPVLADAMRTYVEHICEQTVLAIGSVREKYPSAFSPARLLVTGGGAHNGFLLDRLAARLATVGVDLVLGEPELIDYKEALVMALIGTLRWREENNVLASVTGAQRDSIGGAVWIGQSI